MHAILLELMFHSPNNYHYDDLLRRTGSGRARQCLPEFYHFSANYQLHAKYVQYISYMHDHFRIALEFSSPIIDRLAWQHFNFFEGLFIRVSTHAHHLTLRSRPI